MSSFSTNKKSFSLLGQITQQLVSANLAPSGDQTRMTCDAKNIFATVFKKVVMGGKRDHKVTFTIKEANVQRFGGPEHIMQRMAVDGVVPVSNLIQLVTLRDRRLLEELMSHAISVTLTETSLSAAIKHLYSANQVKNDTKVSAFLGFENI